MPEKLSHRQRPTFQLMKTLVNGEGFVSGIYAELRREIASSRRDSLWKLRHLCQRLMRTDRPTRQN